MRGRGRLGHFGSVATVPIALLDHAQAHVTAQTLLYAVANASPQLHAALLRTVVPTLDRKSVV